MIMESKPYRDYDHGSFEEEWGNHDGSSEWWYATGFLYDEEHNLYSYQFTLNKLYVAGTHRFMSVLSVTDFANNKHLTTQPLANEENITIDQYDIGVEGISLLHREKDRMIIKATPLDQDFSFELELKNGKGSFWHCNNGVLKMGSEDCRETTLYYSYTNMPTTGTLTIGDKTMNVIGKSWFDKQGGKFNIVDPATHWEWFSLRFDDNEEMMLFAYPQSKYYDGTYVPKEGKERRLNNYKLTPLTIEVIDEIKFTTSWELYTPGMKEEHYTLVPVGEKVRTSFMLELLCYIYNSRKEIVGMCIAEILPGVYSGEQISALAKETLDV